MARTRSRTRVSRGTGARRKWVWARHSAVGIAVPAQDAIFSDLLSEFETRYGADLIGATIMRTRGEFKTSQSVVIGARRWQEPVDGVTRLTVDDSPINRPEHDWFLYRPVLLDVTTGVRVVEIDVKSSRKVEELGESILWSVGNIASAAAEVSWDLSLGLKLP